MAHERLRVIADHLQPRLQLRYTLECPRLTKEQRIFYEDNGFLVFKNLVSLGDLDKYKQRFREIVLQGVKVPALIAQKDVSAKDQALTEESVYKLQDFYLDDVLFSYCQLPQILDIVEAFCGPNIMAMHTMLINKPPDKGTKSTRHPLHQDLHYFPFRPEDRIVASWTAMEPVNRDNGCLVVLAGSHKGQLLAHKYPDWEGQVNKLYHGVDEVPEEGRRIYLEMAPGDTVFFHPLLIHGSGANRTKGNRKAISCHYASSECHYIDIRGSSQAMVEEEIIEMVKKQRGLELDFRDIWRFRGKVVRGERINL